MKLYEIYAILWIHKTIYRNHLISYEIIWKLETQSCNTTMQSLEIIENQTNIMNISDLIWIHTKPCTTQSYTIIWHHRNSRPIVCNHIKPYEIIWNHTNKQKTQIVRHHVKTYAIIKSFTFVWIHVKSYAIVWNPIKYLEIIWNHQKSYNIFWTIIRNHVKSCDLFYEFLHAHYNINRNHWHHIKSYTFLHKTPYGIIRNHFEILWNPKIHLTKSLYIIWTPEGIIRNHIKSYEIHSIQTNRSKHNWILMKFQTNHPIS